MSIFDVVDNLVSGSGPKKINKTGIREIRSSLSSNDFSIEKRNDAEAMFTGLGEKAVIAKIKWLRENKSKHKFTPTQIDKLEELLISRF